LGWSHSLLWFDELEWISHPAVDLDRARALFEAAGRCGNWKGWNNLGVLERDGFDRVANPALAFACFQHAGESLQIPALSNLLTCYLDQLGTDRDAAMEELLWYLLAEEVKKVTSD
jgi:hypothetical protein